MYPLQLKSVFLKDLRATALKCKDGWGRLRGTKFQLQNMSHVYEIYSVRM